MQFTAYEKAVTVEVVDDIDIVAKENSVSNQHDDQCNHMKYVSKPIIIYFYLYHLCSIFSMQRCSRMSGSAFVVPTRQRTHVSTHRVSQIHSSMTMFNGFNPRFSNVHTCSLHYIIPCIFIYAVGVFHLVLVFTLYSTVGVLHFPQYFHSNEHCAATFHDSGIFSPGDGGVLMKRTWPSEIFAQFESTLSLTTENHFLKCHTLTKSV